MDFKEKKKILYLGLHLPPSLDSVIHFPIIRIELRPVHEIEPFFLQADSFTHLLLTSPTAFTLTFEQAKRLSISLEDKKFILIGKGTERALLKEGLFKCIVAKKECSEGVIELLETLSFHSSHLFYPHSSLARLLISTYLHSKKIRTTECILYDTVVNRHLSPPSLDSIDEIFFTSPSTVDAFLDIYGYFPENKKLKALGPLTQNYLDKKRTCHKVGSNNPG